MERGAYAPLADHTRPVKRTVTLRSLAYGLIAIELGWFAVSFLLSPFTNSANPTIATLGMLLSFSGMLLTTVWLVRRFQDRAGRTLLGGNRTLNDFAIILRALVIFFVVINLLPPWDFGEIQLAMPAWRWLLLLPVGIAAVLIQVTAEEAVYRGYLLQSLAARFDNRLIWMGVPALLFGLTHYLGRPSESEAIAYVIWATAFGLFCADLTARTGNLGPAIALHFATNVYGILIFSAPGDMSGLALLYLPPLETEATVSAIGLAFDILFTWMLWMVCRIAIRR